MGLIVVQLGLSSIEKTATVQGDASLNIVVREKAAACGTAAFHHSMSLAHNCHHFTGHRHSALTSARLLTDRITKQCGRVSIHPSSLVFDTEISPLTHQLTVKERPPSFDIPVQTASDRSNSGLLSMSDLVSISTKLDIIALCSGVYEKVFQIALSLCSAHNHKGV